MPIHLEVHIPAAAILFLEIAQMAMGKVGAAATSVKSTGMSFIGRGQQIMVAIIYDTRQKAKSIRYLCEKKDIYMYVCINKVGLYKNL